MEEHLLFHLAEGIATFTLNRPEKRNAFTDEMIRRWIVLLEECRERDDVRAIVIGAAGTTFCAGADTERLAGAAQTPVQAWNRMSGVAHAFVREVARIDKPIIAAVNGAAVGGGMDLALMCDVRIAGHSARFAETYAKMGLLPGVGGAWFLPRIVGTAAALDLFWTGRWVDAQEALSLGIVTRVVPDEDLSRTVSDYARQLAQAAPLSVQAIKKLVMHGMSMPLDQHLDTLAAQLAVVRTSADHQEGVAAFRDKREPRFKGC